MEDDALVVIGGGAAGQACVEAYRSAGGGGPVTVVSADRSPPYFRPLLSKELLAGTAAEADAPLQSAGWYAAHDIELRLGCEVAGVDVANRVLATSLGPVRWGRCVLATGSRARALPVPGGDDEGLLYLRDLADNRRLLSAVADSAPVIVIGSGFVGCEVAASLRARGVDVAMVSDESLPQEHRLGTFVGEVLAGWLVDDGVVVRGGRKVQAIEHRGDVRRVRLDDDSVIEGGHVLVATGAKPNVDLAAAVGLPTDDGVPVDASMRTTIPGLLAIGDIAQAFNAAAGRALRVEHWGDATDMGTVAGHVLAGRPAAWDGVPGFWTDIGGRTMKYVAWGDRFDQVTVRRSQGGFTVWYGQGGITVGVLTHEHDEDVTAGTELIRTFAPLPA